MLKGFKGGGRLVKAGGGDSGVICSFIAVLCVFVIKEKNGKSIRKEEIILGTKTWRHLLKQAKPVKY